MWGKEKRVEIHTNPLSRSMLVRIPFDYLRRKILEKTVWYVGESMFNAVQWSSSASASPPSLESIQIWAHLTGVPLDLRHQQGLSLVASLVGEPKETDDFTKNLVSLTLSHVKVVVDLTKPLPDVVEFVRQSGEVVEVQESYPWVPPTCSLYKELGHVARNCLHALPLAKSSEESVKKPQKNHSHLFKKEKMWSILRITITLPPLLLLLPPLLFGMSPRPHPLLRLPLISYLLFFINLPMLTLHLQILLSPLNLFPLSPQIQISLLPYLMLLSHPLKAHLKLYLHRFLNALGLTLIKSHSHPF